MESIKNNIVDHYNRKFLSSNVSNSGVEGMEHFEPEFMIKESTVQEKLSKSNEGLIKFVENYLDNDPKMREVAIQIIKDSEDPLRALANNDIDYLNNNAMSGSLLEVIVQTDGSRPSFLIRNGRVDMKSSPVGEWEGAIVNSANNLKTAIECVGRINIYQNQIGTGFMVHRDLIITNRHVLQSIANENENGNWIILPGAHIDFGHEFKGQLSLNPRKLTRVIFAGTKFIDRYQIDHSKLDMTILELEPTSEDKVPLHLLQVDASKVWTWPESQIFTIGYPGDPGAQGIKNYTSTLLDQLFATTYGCKRLAPGRVMTTMNINNKWTMTHDATTLGGNSGSVIVARPFENLASGLHYGGDIEMPRQNWGHILGFAFESIKNTNPLLYDNLFQKLHLEEINV